MEGLLARAYGAIQIKCRFMTGLKRSAIVGEDQCWSPTGFFCKRFFDPLLPLSV